MLSVVMLSVIMLNVVMLSVIMLNVVMLSVIMLNVVKVSVVAPLTTTHTPIFVYGVEHASALMYTLQP